MVEAREMLEKLEHMKRHGYFKKTQKDLTKAQRKSKKEMSVHQQWKKVKVLVKPCLRLAIPLLLSRFLTSPVLPRIFGNSWLGAVARIVVLTVGAIFADWLSYV